MFNLIDDGSMDTVVEATCEECGMVTEYRYDCETAAHYRDAETGTLDFETFCSEVVVLDHENEECEGCEPNE